MKLNKLIPITLILIFTYILLTACGNDTSYISDQTGKTIPVTSSDSDTYTFKLPAVEAEKTETSVITTEPETTIEEPETPEEAIEKEPLADEGPKTGEP